MGNREWGVGWGMGNGACRTHIIAAPIRFGIEKNSPAIGILSSRLAVNPNAASLAQSLPPERGGQGFPRTPISPLPLFYPSPNLILGHSLGIEIRLMEVFGGGDASEK